MSKSTKILATAVRGEEYFCDPNIRGKTVEVISLVSGGAVYGKNREIINSDWGYTQFRYKGVITDVYREGRNGPIRVDYLTEDGECRGFYPQNIGDNLKVVVYSNESMIAASRHIPDGGKMGKSLRDEFAMAALTGLLSNSGGPIQISSQGGWSLVNCTLDDVSSFAYEMADAMLSAAPRHIEKKASA